MRRRSKPRVVWLPIVNTNSIDAANRSTIQNFGLLIPTVTPGVTASTEEPVIMDGIQSGPLQATSSLADVENSGYRLRRIVGDIWVECFDSEEQTTNAAVVVTAGLIIRRVSSETGTSLAELGGAAFISCDDIENGMDPWIWRRSWLLGWNGVTTGATQLDTRHFNRPPESNVRGSLYNGSHVDQKTARIVGPEERLMLDLTATVHRQGPADSEELVVCTTNLRVLASMRTSSGNRRNASR